MELKACIHEQAICFRKKATQDLTSWTLGSVLAWFSRASALPSGSTPCCGSFCALHSFALTEIILASLAFPRRRRLEIAGGWGCRLGVMLVPVALFIISKTGEMVDTLVRTCQLSSHPTHEIPSNATLPVHAMGWIAMAWLVCTMSEQGSTQSHSRFELKARCSQLLIKLY